MFWVWNPPEMVTLMGLFYRRFECSVIVDGIPSDWFTVESGVRQGCTMSPILFLMAIDWVMRKTTADKPRGIQWTLFSQLEDLDFADDLACNFFWTKSQNRRMTQTCVLLITRVSHPIWIAASWRPTLEYQLSTGNGSQSLQGQMDVFL